MSSQLPQAFISSEFKELSFEDGGLYCGGTSRGKAHGHGVCTGPGGEGQYSGAWCDGFEISGSYVWPNRNVYYGQWMQGKRHGLGMEKRGHWVYQGEMTGGLIGKYGVKKDESSLSRYEGTWASGVQCGYGVEVYSDEGSYVGQWLKGARHGYGIRTSAFFEKSTTSPQPNATRKFSLTLARSEPELIIKDSDKEARVPPSITDLFPPPSREKYPANFKISPVNRIGFFLKGKPKDDISNVENHNSSVPKKISEAFKLGNKSIAGDNANDDKTKQDRNRNLKSDSEKSTEEKVSGMESLLTSITHNQINMIDLKSVSPDVMEVYSGEWKNDKRCGYGVCHRSDGLKYEGEWHDNCKNGFGATTFCDGSREEGCYKNNIFQEPSRRLQVLKMGKLKEQIDSAVTSANKAAQIAAQKAEITLSRAKTAVSKMEQAIQVVDKSILDSKIAQCQLAAHLDQRNQKNAFKSSEESTSGSTDSSHVHNSESINHNQAKSTASKILQRNSKSLLDIRRPPSFHCVNTQNRFSVHSNLPRQRSVLDFSCPKSAVEENVPDFYDSNTDLVTFSERFDKNEVITNKSRRSTLPSIIKYPSNKVENESLSRKKLNSFMKFETIVEDSVEENSFKSNLASFVVQNGCKKLLSSSNTIAGSEAYFEELRWDEYLPIHTQGKLPSYKLQPKQWMNKSDIKSVPDVRFINKWETKVLPKEQAENMCRKVRAEQQKLIELQEQLRKRAIVIKIGEIKAWCKKHFIEFFVLSINIIMAVMFYHLLQ